MNLKNVEIKIFLNFSLFFYIREMFVICREIAKNIFFQLENYILKTMKMSFKICFFFKYQ